MYTDAFKTIFSLCKNENIVKEILFTKKGFRVRWTQEKKLFWFKIETLTESIRIVLINL